MKLLLVDGSNLLFQMFYGMPSRILNSRGKAIQGTLGFVGALLKIIRRTRPDSVIVLFDGPHKNVRTEIDPDYKANRPDYSQMPEEETPFSQLPDIYAALDWLGIRHTETTDCETDDLMASYAYTYGQDMSIVISSFDSDFFQLITDSVSVLRYRGDHTVIWTPNTVRQKLGITPEQYADHKSLTGDSSDNIRGAEKVGPKTATQLLEQFGSLEGIIAHAEEITKPSVRESILQSTDRLRRNYSIIKLSGCVPLPFTPAQAHFTDRGMTTTEVLRKIGAY